MKPGKAMEVLGLVGTALAELTREQVDRAFTEAVKRNHPDTTGQALENLAADIAAGVDVDAPREVWTVDSLKEAREVLRQVVAGANNRCRTCKGSGIIRAKMGSTPCVACKGTGDKRGS